MAWIVRWQGGGDQTAADAAVMDALGREAAGPPIPLLDRTVVVQGNSIGLNRLLSWLEPVADRFRDLECFVVSVPAGSNLVGWFAEARTGALDAMRKYVNQSGSATFPVNQRRFDRGKPPLALTAAKRSPKKRPKKKKKRPKPKKKR